MEQVFSVYKIDNDRRERNSQVYFHGRALKILKRNQPVYLTNDRSTLGIIVDIISYGHNLDEIEPVMSCSLIIQFEGKISIPDDIEWLYG